MKYIREGGIMKKKILSLLVILLLLTLTACKEEKTDSQKFKEEYPSVSEYNVFVYRNSEEIIKILEHGTAIVYLGFPECPWCQAYVPMLNEVADTEGLEKIYYYNIYNDRKENTDAYQKIVDILSENLQYDNEGNKRIYVPAIIAISDGEIIGYDDETSYDTLGFEKPEDYWIEERIKSLKIKLSNMISTIVDNKCTDCNEE